MSIYKVIVTRTSFVEADSAEEAEEMAMEGLDEMSSEEVTSVRKTSRNGMLNFMRGVIYEQRAD